MSADHDLPTASTTGYENLEPEFSKLRDLDTGSTAFRRAREDIICRCLPLAEHVARRYSGRGVPFDDLEQVARVGVMMAVDRYDVDRGSPFLCFAVPTVMGEVRRHFRDKTWALRVTRRDKEHQARVSAAVDVLTQRLQHWPTVSEIAAETGLDRAEVLRTQVTAEAYHTDSLDARFRAADQQEGGALAETLGYDEPCYDLTERSMAAAPAVAALPAEDRQLLQWRFFARLSQQQIARRLGVSQMSVSRRLSRLLDDLRRHLDDEPAPAQVVRPGPARLADATAGSPHPR
ncbi:SigB/SigF/SigG family RNA polymerase sigma factor [Nocardia thailandica]|uniref:SigB/SigF/SigG family RNA polymerase sigma factor n=1 Tax=Nocardia thailandica TaxID=257275 RepID=A0ABW6PXF1_9NOCA